MRWGLSQTLVYPIGVEQPVLIGYIRVSKADGSQTLDLQRDALHAGAHSQSAHATKLTNRSVRSSSVTSSNSIAVGSPGARILGYGLWLMRLQPFEDGLQRLALRR